MTPFLAELTGTALLILLGTSVVANVVLHQTKGHGGGWIVITFGWGMAVFVGVYAAAPSGGHLNPAVSVAMAYLGKLPWAMLPQYVAGQFAGAMLGAACTWLAYKQHFDATDDADGKLAVFCNAPAIPHTGWNLLTETIATCAFMLGVLFMSPAAATLGTLDALPAGLLVLGVGLSMGGPTGYAINPARDLGPRIVHALLPVKNKRGSNWRYSWIPVAGPLLGGLLAAILFQALKP